MKRCPTCGHCADEMEKSPVKAMEIEMSSDTDEDDEVQAKDELLSELLEKLSDSLASKLPKSKFDKSEI